MIRVATDERLEVSAELRKMADHVDKQAHQPTGMVLVTFYGGVGGGIETAVKLSPEFNYLLAVGYFAMMQKMFLNQMDIQVRRTPDGPPL